MTLYELAKQIVCSIIAVALSMTVAAVEGLLPHRPDWLERVEHLAIHLRSIAARAAAAASAPEEAADASAGRTADTTPPVAPQADAAAVDTERLLRAYNQLWQFVHNLRSEGLSLDESFCERVEREWSVTTLLTYMRNADKSLQDHASKALATAADVLALPPERSRDPA